MPRKKLHDDETATSMIKIFRHKHGSRKTFCHLYFYQIFYK